MRRFLYLLLLLSLSACELFGTAAPPPPTVTLTASRTEGPAPLAVTFSAVASPSADTFSWTVGSERRSETGSVLETVFETPGLYSVRVSANGATDLVTVRAGVPDAPAPMPGELRLSATPGGPAPWAVRYTVVAESGEVSLRGLEARCEARLAFGPLRSASFVCLHDTADTVQVRRVGTDGGVLAEAETAAAVTENSGVAFAGRWRYRSRGVTETFEITEGGPTEGRSADGRFALFTVGERLGLVAEFTVDGQTVVLTPTPGDDGKQLYRGEVYGLVLEPTTEDRPRTPGR